MLSTLVKMVILVACVLVGVILWWLLSPAPWYRCIEFSAFVVLSVWGFLWLLEAWQKKLEQDAAWLAIRTLVLDSGEIERFRSAYESRDPEEIKMAKEEALAAIRSLQ